MTSLAVVEPTLQAQRESFSLPIHDATYLLVRGSVALVLGVILFMNIHGDSKVSSIPLINQAKGLDIANWGWRWRFAFYAEELLQKGMALYKDRPFKLMTDSGEIIVLPSKLVSTIGSEDRLLLRESVAEDFHAHLPGFEVFAAAARYDQLGQSVVRKRLTRSLNKITEPLSQEVSFATELRLGNGKEWKKVYIYKEILDIVARSSSRVFLGPEICRNEAWLDITKRYTSEAFIGSAILRAFPNWFRNVAHWVIPQCRNLRWMAPKAREIITPFIEERRRLRAESLAKGEEPEKFDDAIDWFEDESNGAPYDAAIAQLGLSMAAIHTTSDLLTETLLRLARRPELVEELRSEVIQELRKDGWKKTSLYNMKLLDSVIKESQRLRPISMGKQFRSSVTKKYDTNSDKIVSMVRKAVEDVPLPTGEVIPKGHRTVVLTDQHRSAELFTNPDVFDGHRFVRQRACPETENTAHFVSTTSSSLGFGHGKHACPGRFFAANELKVILCHLLVKYDWKVGPNAPAEPEPLKYSFALQADPWAQVYLKRRDRDGLDIDAI
ncbi:unnamed protein product [Clonostachys chloroleuca]|uniref:Uncharacterized protein n=1 Tax=Clonostachys chloroleuca TaxID=1926264 RepID=A0AA35M9Z1_9HYPO|nr:unnamed protein product [Clonostachys chloroleuca]